MHPSIRYAEGGVPAPNSLIDFHSDLVAGLRLIDNLMLDLH